MEKDKISVIIPIYNAARTIERCIDSILEGKYQNIEIIIINDGSTDGTEEIINNYKIKDDRIVLINQKNRGVGYAKSIGIRSSSGDYIAFCDADDWYDEDYLYEHYKHIVKYDADISQCRTYVTSSDDAGNTDKIELMDSDLLKNYISYQGINVTLWDKLYKREILDTEEIVIDCRYSEDLYMNYVASKHASRVVKFDTTKYNWYVNPNSLSRATFNPVKLENDFSVWDRIINDCKKNYPQYTEIARCSSVLWICGTYRSMVNSHYHNRVLEKKIAKYIKQCGILTPLKTTRQPFIKVSLLSMPLARYTWYMIEVGKKYVKRILRR